HCTTSSPHPPLCRSLMEGHRFHAEGSLGTRLQKQALRLADPLQLQKVHPHGSASHPAGLRCQGPGPALIVFALRMMTTNASSGRWEEHTSELQSREN